MKKKISELELYEVDFLVAKAEKLEIEFDNDDRLMRVFNLQYWSDPRDTYKYTEYYNPTTNPSQAWPIIEREGIDLIKNYDGLWESYIKNYESLGRTSLESAMRCYCGYKFGEEVEI